MKPLAIDLFCGLGGWTEGLLAEGYEVVGFDLERHEYWGEEGGDRTSDQKNSGGGSWFTPMPGRKGPAKNCPDGRRTDLGRSRVTDARVVHRYPAQLVLQDVLTLHGSQFRDASLIVASPPCQEYSYMAMPWSRAKQIAAEYRAGIRDTKKLTALFDACFRIQREACEAAGRHIPLVVENVRGAIPWVGRSRWNFGSFHLWGDVPALMPMTKKLKNDGKGTWFHGAHASGGNPARGAAIGEGYEVRHVPFGDSAFCDNGVPIERKRELVAIAARAGIDPIRLDGWFAVAHNKGFKDFNDRPFAQFGSKSSARKAASAMIARIPAPLARHIAQVYRP